MVNKRIGAMLCAALLLSCGAAAAEEKHIGDLIYVPAMTVKAQSGTYALRVAGLSLPAQGDEPQEERSVAGAEFGVYVISSSGELMPWANPLYPSEPMRIRTGEGETRFSLPQGTEFYLRQESAPEGYRFDAQTLIPVTDGEIVVRNAMAGQLVLTAQDSLGEPVCGASFTVIAESGEVFALVSDEDGQAVLECAQPGVYRVEESALPTGVYEAVGVKTGREADVVSKTAYGISVRVSDASRTRVTYEHPASGSVQLVMKLAVLGDDGQTQEVPLSGVRLDISGDSPITLITDESGTAHASLLEGQYTVSLTCDDSAVLPVSEGMMIVESGSTTVIELTASQTTGRILLSAAASREIAGASMTLSSEETGETFGPYALDGDCQAVSAALKPGMYTLSVTPPGDMLLGTLSCGALEAQAQPLSVEVSAGQLTQVQAELLALEAQRYELLASCVGEDGSLQSVRIDEVLELELIDGNDQTAATLQSEDGYASVEALTGEYRLRMSEKAAQALDVQRLSAPFELPGSEESITFGGVKSRLILASVNDQGEPVSGAVYAVTDSAGERCQVTADENGMAVTPLLCAGEALVENVTAPDDHDTAPALRVDAIAGEAVRAELVHEQHGSAAFSARLQRLDERGEPSLAVLSDVLVRVETLSGQPVLSLMTGEDGLTGARLPEGEYIAQLDMTTVGEVCRSGGSVRFAVENGQSVQIELLCYDVLGGVSVSLVGGTLSGEELAQVRFELTAQDATAMRLTGLQEGFYLGNLAEGTYTLRQTQMPQGYTLGAERSVTVVGGQATRVSVPLEEYAELSVSKTGLTFSDTMQTYVVPLTGEYGVYTLVDGEMLPYPSEAAQMTVWSNVTPEQIADGCAARLRLPADVEGTTYYLREISAAQGFELDETYHEVTLTAGGEQTLSCAVSSDRGFFSLDQADAATGAHVSGGTFELSDAETGETVLSFVMPEEAYTNPMAIAVGRYILRQTQAAPGYALSAMTGTEVVVEPYLTQGGAVTSVSVRCTRVPETPQMQAISELYAAQEQGLTLVTVGAGTLAPGETLVLPRMSLALSAPDGTRLNVRSVQLDGAADSQGTAYMARVEYCLADGGWQPSDARMTGVLSSPASVSLSDVPDDVCAVRVTYLDAQTGEEIAREGFTPGRVTLDVITDSESALALHADASFTGSFVYTLSQHGELLVMERTDSAQLAFEATGSGRFVTALAGRDGRISGTVFFDTDADGVLEASESGRYAGMTVTLVTQSGEEAETCRTDAQGRYSFDSISAGAYTVRFDAPEGVAFSRGTLYAEQTVSSIEDTRYGESRALFIDGDHTDYVINAGCIYAAQVSGTLLERAQNGELVGYGSLSAELLPTQAGAEEEPFVVLTDEAGAFCMTGVLPGDYELSIALPEGYLSQDAKDGIIRRTLSLGQGDAQTLGAFVMERGASVSGSVRVDDDGDGVIADGAQTLADVTVKLLRVRDGHSEQVAQTQTDAHGAYTFDMLASGDYSVLFELAGDWAFTRYGGDSLVYGAAGTSGSTESFTLTSGIERVGVDAGVTIPAQLTVSVFKDTQFDGQKGVYEEMLADVGVTLVRLENGEDAQRMTCVTGDDGLAIFEGVSPGEYVLEYQMPDAWRATKQVDPQTTSYPVSCVPQSTLAAGRSLPFTLAMGEKDARLYIGAMLSGSISGTVYYDDNADARRDESEAAVTGALVELLNARAQTLAQTTPDDSGAYAFEGLAPGRYTVRFTVAQGCGFSATERSMVRGSVQESDSNISSTRPITVTSGDAMTAANAGVVRLGSLAGSIWIDSNADGVRDAEETTLDGVEIALMNGSGRNILSTAVTDAQGAFAFESVRPGTYMLRASAPDGYVFSGALNGSPLPVNSERDGRIYTSPFTLLGGARVEGVAFGLYTQSAVTGRVWLDKDYDGMLGDAEDGLRGAVLTLYDADGNLIAQTTSQRTGEYSFVRLAPGSYSMRVDLPDGYVYTRDDGESIAAHVLDVSQVINLGAIAMGETLDRVNIGALAPAAVGGIVWMDADNDGRRQPADAGVAGVGAVLLGAKGEIVATAETDTSGAYRFENVMPGEYSLRFELSDGQAFSRQVAGTRRVSCVPQTDALEAASPSFAIASGANRTDLDVGVVSVAEITGTIWEDAAYDGRYGGDERGVSGTTVALIEAESGRIAAQTQSGEDGGYTIGFVRTGTYMLRVTLPDGMIFTRQGESAIADRNMSEGETAVFTLAMGEGRDALHIGAIAPAVIRGSLYVDEDENGTKDAEETGLSGAVVTLMQGGTVVESRTSSADGAFAFETVRPGEYRVRVTLPKDTLFAAQTPLTLADRDATEGETPAFEMTMGQQAQIEPLGAVRAAVIAGTAWLDANADGRMDRTEAPLPGTRVELLALDAQGGGRIVADTAVDAGGGYSFGMLRSGTYVLRVTLPEGMLFADCMQEPGGSAVPVVSGHIGLTEPMTLSMGEQRRNVNIGGIEPGELGDSVWLDVNGNGLQDYLEPMLPGVELILWRVERDGSLQEADRTVSDTYGYYRFTNLRPGTYVVGVALGDGDTLTYSFGAPLGEIDSDIDPETGRSGQIVLFSGQKLRSIDVGFTEHN